MELMLGLGEGEARLEGGGRPGGGMPGLADRLSGLGSEGRSEVEGLGEREGREDDTAGGLC